MYQARVIQLFVASPGDLHPERKIIPDVVNEWNITNGEKRLCLFVPRMWEFDLPHGGYDDSGAQHLIDTTILARADACIALFWSTMGSLGPDSIPNSVHELDSIRESGRPTYVWIKDASIPVNRSGAGRELVNDFVSSARTRGYLTGSFKTRNQLASLILRVLDDLSIREPPPAIEDPVDRLGSRFSVVIRRSGQSGYIVLKNMSDSVVDVNGISLAAVGGPSPQLTSDVAPGLLANNGIWREILFFAAPVKTVHVEINYEQSSIAKTELLEVAVVTESSSLHST